MLECLYLLDPGAELTSPLNEVKGGSLHLHINRDLTLLKALINGGEKTVPPLPPLKSCLVDVLSPTYQPKDSTEGRTEWHSAERNFPRPMESGSWHRPDLFADSAESGD